MNIEEVINKIRIRPGMYVKEIRLDYIRHFLDGFLYNNIITSRADTIDLHYKENFYEWVYIWALKHSRSKELKKELSWTILIDDVAKNSQEESVRLFFDICDDFFNTFYEHN